MDPSEVTKLIEAGFDGAIVKVISNHQLVYECLGSLMGNEIHAMSIKALTPEEWRAAGGGA
jgi:acid stress-induced BolA-like protein IbaG/YrbA